jgi:predicted enzyme related to lactoylglutathione lyase
VSRPKDDEELADPDAPLAFYRDTLGFEVRNDVAYGGMRRITVGPADQPGTSIYVGFEAEGQHIGLVPGGGPQGMTSPVAYWHVPDIEAKLAEVTAAGATVKERVRDVGRGRLVATVIDPDGNVLGLLQDR